MKVWVTGPRALKAVVFVFFLALITWRTRDQSGASLSLNGVEIDVPKTLVGSHGSHDHQKRANPFRRLRPAIHIRTALSRAWRVSLVDSENHWAGISTYPLDGLLRNVNAESAIFREAYGLGPLPSVERMTVGGLKGCGAWVIQPHREILIAEVAGKGSRLYVLLPCFRRRVATPTFARPSTDASPPCASRADEKPPDTYKGGEPKTAGAGTFSPPEVL